jgi:hypothetical protein
MGKPEIAIEQITQEKIPQEKVIPITDPEGGWPRRNCGCRQRLGVRHRVYPAAHYLEAQVSYETALSLGSVPTNDGITFPRCAGDGCTVRWRRCGA